MQRFLSLLAASSVCFSLHAASPVEQQVVEGIKSAEVSIVHLWAPWCSNCLAELKSGEWGKSIQANPQVRFYFVSVWNSGDDGRAVLKKFGVADQPNVSVLADPGPRRGDGKITTFLDLPLTWIPATWVYKGGELRYAMNYGEVRFPVLQQFIDDSRNEWSRKGEKAAE